MDIVKKTQKKVAASKKKLTKTLELKSYRKLAVNFLILSVNLIIIILYFSLSQARVTIAPAQEELSHTLTLPIKEEVGANDSELAIPGSVVSTEVTLTKTFVIAAESTIDDQASGTITIKNINHSRTQIFVANTRFQNEEGIEIKTKSQVQIPVGGEVVVSAFATEKGIAGEVNANSGRFQVVALPYLKNKIYAEVQGSFTGGTRTVKTVTQTILENARVDMEEELRTKGFELLSQSNASVTNRDELALNITKYTTTVRKGDTNADEFSATAAAVVSAFSYDESRPKEIIKQELIKRIPLDKILVSFNNNSYKTTVDEETLRITATISANIQSKIPEAALNQQDIVGMNQDEVREHFTKITGIQDVEVKFWPFWVRSVPNLKDHVDIEIKK
jgi:hypothetical protein